MKTLTSDDYKNFPRHAIPGSQELKQFKNLDPFSQYMIELSFDPDDNAGTQQTNQIQQSSEDQQNFILDQSESFKELTRRVRDPELDALRGQNPFVDLIRFPMKSLFIVAQKANDTRDVTLPDNTQAIRFSANNNIDFFVSANGQIQFPIQEDLTGGGVLYCPRDQWYYVRGFKNLSIGLPIISTGVCIQCFIQN